MRIKLDNNISIHANSEITAHLNKLTQDTELREYMTKFGLKFFNTDEDLYEDTRCHTVATKVATEMEEVFRDKRLDQEFPLVDCDTSHIEKAKLKLIRQNIDSLALDVEHFFVKEGVVQVHEGLKPLYSILFLTKKDSLVLFTKNHVTNTTRSLDMSLKDNKPDVLFGLTAAEYLDKAKTRIVPISLSKMAEELCTDDLALVLYINNLATTRTIRTSKVERKASTTPPRREYKHKGVVTLPRVHYTLNSSGTLTREGINRHTESWLVTGHWRHFKNGNKTWIEPFIKGKGNPDRKVYKI